VNRKTLSKRDARNTGGGLPLTKGFTIIEVLIVLAVAGLIMIVVFLAVPALQRNSRNAQYRSEASRITSTTTEFINNNNGTLPSASTCSGIGGGATNCDYTTTPNSSMSIWQLSNAKNITGITVVSASATAVTPTLTTITIDTSATCPTSVSGTSVTPVTGGTVAPKKLAIIYAIESSGGLQAQCISS